jgi:hypothetical protein
MAAAPKPTWAPYVAIWKVEELLRKVTEALNRAGLPYAVVGGNAVAAWVATIDPGAIRSTKDLDILTSREKLDDIANVLQLVGLERHEVLGVPVFVDKQDPRPSQGVHIIFANERVKPSYILPAPGLDQITKSITSFPVVNLMALLIMKLLSWRDRDRSHIRDLIAVGLVGRDMCGQLPELLGSRLQFIFDNPED